MLRGCRRVPGKAYAGALCHTNDTGGHINFFIIMLATYHSHYYDPVVLAGAAAVGMALLLKMT